MEPLIGLGLGGPALALPAAAGSRAILGRPAWGARGLLRDLELRLGLPAVVESASTRTLQWSARIASLGDEGAFYMRSFAVDALGTAEALLAWRDALIEAGWSGAVVAGGGDRLNALASLERHDAVERMQLGEADRLVRVEHALAAAPARLYEAVALVEDVTLWPSRWQSICRLLGAQGTSFTQLAIDLPGAPSGCDLAVLQARLRGDRTTPSVRGDGTLLLVRGDTAGDLAELTASLVADGVRAGLADLVVRCRDDESLEAALARQGLSAQGCANESVWRPAMQVLPLAVELAFEPRDPQRVLELLTLSLGPFRGVMGGRLARAVARQPGVGGKEWVRQKTDAAARLRERHARAEREQGKSDADAEQSAERLVAQRLQVVKEWLEERGAGPEGVTRAALLAVVERVRAWIQGRLRQGEVAIYGAAQAQVATFAEAVAHDTRAVFSREEARQLVDRFARSEQGHPSWVEAAGRTAHVAHPSALLTSFDSVFIWSFVAGVERRPSRVPWNDEERAALQAAGVRFVDPSALLRAESEAWRRAVLAARARVVLVVPRTIKGTATAPHPLWDEICARLALDEPGAARITRDVRQLLEGMGGGLIRVETCLPLLLPEGRSAWRVPPAALEASAGDRNTSVTALETIATCPLAWVLEHRADLRAGAISRIATGALLSGGLSHRLVEELHAAGAFEQREEVFLARSSALCEALLQTEGATLLLPGASIERLQLARQVRQAMRALYRYLEKEGFRIAGVEEIVTTSSVVGDLHGRLDLRLVDGEGRTAILDLKWGASSYRRLLQEGRAVQLAAYSRSVAVPGAPAAAPPAAYFALSSGQVLSTDARMSAGRTIDGPSLAETWRRVEATATAVIASHDRGEIHVSATRRSLPLLEALGIPAARRGDHFAAAPDAACSYCDYDALCGRKWEAFS